MQIAFSTVGTVQLERDCYPRRRLGESTYCFEKQLIKKSIFHWIILLQKLEEKNKLKKKNEKTFFFTNLFLFRIIREYV